MYQMYPLWMLYDAVLDGISDVFWSPGYEINIEQPSKSALSLRVTSA